MTKVKTIFQPLSFSKLFDAEMAELFNEGWCNLEGYPRVISHETKEDVLMTIMAIEEDN